MTPSPIEYRGWGGSPVPHCDCGHPADSHASGNLARSNRWPGKCTKAIDGGGWCHCPSYNPETDARRLTFPYQAQQRARTFVTLAARLGLTPEGLAHAQAWRDIAEWDRRAILDQVRRAGDEVAGELSDRFGVTVTFDSAPLW